MGTLKKTYSLGEILRKSTLERLDTELLLAFILKKDRVFVLAHPEAILNERQMMRFRSLALRRRQHEPLAYILGQKEFYGHSFKVNRATLIPRPETELLVEEAIAIIEKETRKEKKKKIAIIDVGTGSGAIIVSLAKYFANSPLAINFFATDISKRALAVAKENKKSLGAASVFFAHGNLLSPLRKQLKNFDLVVIVANLPYLSQKLYRSTDPTVQKYEPKGALLSGKDGLDHYRRLSHQLRRIKRLKKTFFLLEISPEQQSSALEFLPQKTVVKKDLAGLPRLVTGILE